MGSGFGQGVGQVRGQFSHSYTVQGQIKSQLP